MIEAATQRVISEITENLESVFNEIYKQRMQDVPITNDDIKVRAIGFQPWQNTYLGVMITPWFMNLMLLPGETENWDEKQELSASDHIFPSGRYEFLVGFEPGIGKYQMCSLFSPMFDFADNDAAIETAEAVINEIMNNDNVEEADINSSQIEDIWNGVEKKPDTSDTTENHLNETKDEKSTESLTEKMEKPMSRRKLLRGALMMENEEQ